MTNKDLIKILTQLPEDEEIHIERLGSYFPVTGVEILALDQTEAGIFLPGLEKDETRTTVRVAVLKD